MMFRSLVILTVLPLAFLLFWNNASPGQHGAIKPGGISNSITIQASENTPTPSPASTELQPTPAPARQREPGLVAGAIIIGAIIIFGVLRYSRSK